MERCSRGGEWERGNQVLRCANWDERSRKRLHNSEEDSMGDGGEISMGHSGKRADDTAVGVSYSGRVRGTGKVVR